LKYLSRITSKEYDDYDDNETKPAADTRTAPNALTSPVLNIAALPAISPAHALSPVPFVHVNNPVCERVTTDRSIRNTGRE
jgi:hypothetical protein